MEWNDTISLLLRHDIGKDAFIANDKKDLFIYRDNIIKQSEGIIGKKYYDFENCDKKNLYSKISQTSIPQNYWHINFPQLAPPFIKSAQDYINGAIKRRKEEPRKSFWLGIKEKGSEKIIGVVSISLKVKQDKDKKNRIGHFGRFIHPEFQKKGYISEVGAVMLDFMYKYLIEKNTMKIYPKSYFYMINNIEDDENM